MQPEMQQEIVMDEEVAQPLSSEEPPSMEQPAGAAAAEEEAPPEVPQEEEAAAVSAEEAAAAAEKAAADEEAEKQQKKERRRREDNAAVKQAIAECESLPEHARAMLSDGFDAAAGEESAGSGGGEPMVVAFVGLVADSLDAELKRLATNTAECGDAQREAEQELLRLESGVIEAMTTGSKAGDQVDAKVAASVEVAEEVAREEVRHEEARQALSGLLEACQEARDTRERTAAAADGPLRALSGGIAEGDEAKEKAISEVLEYISDKVLLAGAAPALAVAPEQRKSFDELAVSEVSAIIGEQVQSLDKQIADTAAEEAQAKAELLGAWAIADCARDALKAAEAAVKEAKAEARHAHLAVEVAKDEVQGQKRKNSELAIRMVLNEANDAKVRKGLSALARLTGKDADEAVEEKEAAAASADVEMKHTSGKEAAAAASPTRRNPLGVATPAVTL